MMSVDDPMDPFKAADLSMQCINPEVLELAEQHPEGDGSSHMAWMFKEIAKREMSIGKANRWIGWAQCLAMIYRHLTLDQCKHINRRAS